MNHEEHKVVSLINNDDSNENTTETPLQPVKRDRKGIYLLPNLFTTGALFSGFYAVVAGMNGHFENAAIPFYRLQRRFRCIFITVVVVNQGHNLMLFVIHGDSLKSRLILRLATIMSY